MRKIIGILLVSLLTLPLGAQNKKPVQKKKQTTTVTKKPVQKKKGKSAKTTVNKSDYSTPSIKGLQNQRTQIQKEIHVQEKALKANQEDVKQRLQNLLLLNTAIDERQKSIEGIQQDITNIDGNINILKAQLQTLKTQLEDRKEKYVQSMRYLARYRNVQDKLMFVFSAKNFAQMFRRVRFVHQYADYQRAQGELVKAKQAQVTDKQKQLENVKGQKNVLLSKDKKERQTLEVQQDEQKKIVSSLQKQQKTIQGILVEQRKKDAALNAQIDRLIAIEVEKARVRAEAEAKRKAAAEAAAKKRAERLAEAREREEKAKAEARDAALAEAKAKREEAREAAIAAASDRKARAEQAAREAEAERLAVERKARAEEERAKKEIEEVVKENDEGMRMSSIDRMMSGGFAANKGRLPMPITGSYKIVSHFGQYNVEGLKNVTLDNKGINILGKPGCMARSIYDGEVSAVFSYAGTWVVMVRHGAYISVYCNLKSVTVSRGQKVSTGQAMGSVGTDNILQFQLRHEKAKLNPEAWLKR